MPPDSLRNFVGDIDLDGLRIRRPSKFVFLCGGAIVGEDVNLPRSLRQYLLHNRNMERGLGGKVILAERASELYRDSKYGDLITFEEDIARIAAVVMIIAESAGSFAELGAFSTNETIINTLLVLGQSKFSEDESFIRFGPMERVKKFDQRRLAFYPWRVRSDGRIIRNSIDGHFARIKGLVNQHLSRVPLEQLHRLSPGFSQFSELLWLLHICRAMTLEDLALYHSELFGTGSVNDSSVLNKLYCMRLADWVGFYTYESKQYWYYRSETDPFAYRFRPGVTEKDSLRRKSDVMRDTKLALRVPRHVLVHVSSNKIGDRVDAN